MRKFSIILLVILAIVVSVFACTINLGYRSFTSGEFTYRLNNNDTAEIIRFTNTESDSALVIPTYIDGYKVVNIATGAIDCEGLESIVVADELDYIEDGAFFNCQDVIYLSWPGSLICNSPFKDLNSVIELTISFGQNGFMADYPANKKTAWNDSNNTISTITVEDGIRYLSNYAFANLSGLTEIELPETVEAIGKYCFYNDNNIEFINLYYGLSSIGEGCFSSDNLVTNKNTITIPQSVTYFGKNALSSNYNYLVYAKSLGQEFLNKEQGSYQIIDLSFKLNDNKIELGQSTNLVFNSIPSSFKEDIIYTSSDPEVFVVSDEGILFSSGTGNADVMIATDTGRFSQNVNVVYDHEGEAKYMRLNLKEEYKIMPLEYESFLYGQSETFTFSSSNSKVCKVNENGVVKGLKSGYATIKITNQDGLTNHYLFRVQSLLQSIKLSQNSISMRKGNTYTINAKALPTNADNKTLTYKSSNTEVAVVNSKGKITALGLGTCQITISSNDGSNINETIAVSVTNSSISVETKTIATMVGKGFQLRTTTNSNQKLIYSSADETIATVDQNGRITGVSDGITIITIANQRRTSFTTVTVRVYDAVDYGIDISRWNGNYLKLENFQKCKEDGIDFVMIRAGSGVNKDKNFESNYNFAKKAGLKVGVYGYCLATNNSEAKAEAKAMIQWLQGKKLEYPVALDIEDKLQKNLSREAWRAIVETYCKTLNEAGYYVIVYSYSSMLNRTTGKYDSWIAQWHVTNPYLFNGNYTMWQFTDKGKVEGFSGKVDMNISFFDYEKFIKENHYNGY